MEAINEKSTYIITVSFKDETGAPVVPTPAWYSLFCETTGTEIKAETELTGLGTSKDIEITPEENKIQNSENSAEVKVLTVRFTYAGGSKQGTGQYRYVVTNLQKIT
jgi:hypothetical protein